MIKPPWSGRGGGGEGWVGVLIFPAATDALLLVANLRGSVGGAARI